MQKRLYKYFHKEKEKVLTMFLSSDTLNQIKSNQIKSKSFLGIEIREELTDASVVITFGCCGFYCNSDIIFDEEPQYTPFLKGGYQPKADWGGIFNILNSFKNHQTRLLFCLVVFIFQI